jgi:hypothetical protein
MSALGAIETGNDQVKARTRRTARRGLQLVTGHVQLAPGPHPRSSTVAGAPAAREFSRRLAGSAASAAPATRSNVRPDRGRASALADREPVSVPRLADPWLTAAPAERRPARPDAVDPQMRPSARQGAAVTRATTAPSATEARQGAAVTRATTAPSATEARQGTAVGEALVTPPSGVGGGGAVTRKPSVAARPQAARRPERVPVRLTRRGRIVVAVFAVVLATAAMALIGMGVAGGAQAASHGRNGAGYQGMHQVVVEPGETLWSIASKADPDADPRLVISEIMAANSMTSTVVQAGQLIWVPK